MAAHHIQDDIPLLELMMADQINAKSLYIPGPHWLPYQRRVLAALRSNGLLNFRSSEAISKGYGDPMACDPLQALFAQDSAKFWLASRMISLPVFSRLVVEYRRLIDFQSRRHLRYRDRWFRESFGDWYRAMLDEPGLPDTLIGGCNNFVEIGGDKLAYLYLSMLRLYDNFFTSGVRFDEANSFMEIGGGFGALTHILLHRHTNIRKVIYIDIPPILYVASQFLKFIFGESVKDYQATKASSSLTFSNNDEREILCLCPWQIEQLQGLEIDIFWNSTSFQEMVPSAVQNLRVKLGWADELRRFRCLFGHDRIKPRNIPPNDKSGGNN